ncbi:hypothetical protein KAX02_00455 [candidate division WOR-3 bacterium]|nr:hypothetical protein [candidate division WOR-3 bacterium]
MDGKNVFRQKFTRIEGLSAIRRLPRLGKIRLGIKKVSAKTGKEYPSETDYFVCPAEVRNVCGDEPKELNISFPMNDPEVIFPQCYKWYGSSKGLKCRGDGVNALRLNDETNEMEERTCPCELLESGKCKQRASLIFNLPGVAIGGVYQIDLSSYHSIVDINSGIDYARALLGDRIAFIPFKLKRVPKETHNEGKKQIHYTLQLELNVTAKELQGLREGQKVFAGQNKRYEIEAPKEDISPAYDSKEDGAVIEEETEEEIKAREAKEAEEEKVRQEALKKEYDELNERQAKLKKEMEEGKHKLKSYEEAKAIYKKKQEERVAVEAEPVTEDTDLATQPQKDKIYGNVVCEKCGTRVYGFKCPKCKNADNMHITTKGFIHSHLLTKNDFKNDMKPILFPDKLTKIEAMIIWDWWLGDKQNNIVGERTVREAKEIEARSKTTKADKIKKAQDIVDGKLEVKDEEAPFPDEAITDADIPGSSPDNAIPFTGKRRGKAKATD